MSTLKLEISLQGEQLEIVSMITSLESWQTWLHTWLVHLSPNFSPIGAYELSIQFTSDQGITALNNQYRQQDGPTDVLSFVALDNNMPLSEGILAEIPFNLGDLIISVETAQRQCETHGHSLLEELAWLMAHGLLHLLGWDHPDELQLGRMLSMQRDLLTKVGMHLEDSQYFA